MKCCRDILVISEQTASLLSVIAAQGRKRQPGWEGPQRGLLLALLPIHKIFLLTYFSFLQSLLEFYSKSEAQREYFKIM